MISFYPIFAESTTLRNITCFLSDTRDGCLIGVYVNKTDNMNSHASLCNVDNISYVNCYIISFGGVLSPQYKIPINFIHGNNCKQENKILLYLYKNTNSHVSLVQGANLIPICLSKEFSDVLDNTSGYPLISLYRGSNSHVKAINRAGGDSVRLNFSDNIPPNITIEQVDPTTIKITYSDDSYLYSCKYGISETVESDVNCAYSKNYIINLNLTEDHCEGGTCTIVAEAVDLTGNIKSIILNLIISRNPFDLYFEPEIRDFLRLLLTSQTYKMYVKNKGNIDVANVTLTFKRCERNLQIWYNNVPIKELHIGTLKGGEEKIYEITFVPMVVGTCNLEIMLKGEIGEKEVTFTKSIIVQIGTKGPADIILVSEYLPIIPIILVAIIMILLI